MFFISLLKTLIIIEHISTLKYITSIRWIIAISSLWKLNWLNDITATSSINATLINSQNCWNTRLNYSTLSRVNQWGVPYAIKIIIHSTVTRLCVRVFFSDYIKSILINKVSYNFYVYFPRQQLWYYLSLITFHPLLNPNSHIHATCINQQY